MLYKDCKKSSDEFMLACKITQITFIGSLSFLFLPDFLV